MSSAAEQRPADYAARQLALDPRQSFAVAAPAGSGKTGLLTQRVLALLATVEEPEEVLSITFTRKAAAEMRNRIFEALHSAQSPPPEAEYELATWQLARAVLARDIDRQWGLLDNSHRLRIQTIDGFCRHLASQLALESGMGDIPEPLDNTEPLYCEAARGLLARIDEGSAVGEQLAQLLLHMGGDLPRVEGLFAELLADRLRWLPYLGHSDRHYFEQVLAHSAEPVLAQAEAALQGLLPELVELAACGLANLRVRKPDYDKALKYLADQPMLRADAELLNPWRGIAELLLTGDKWRQPKGVTATTGFPAGTPENARMKQIVEALADDDYLRLLLVEIRDLPNVRYSDEQWQLLEVLLALLPHLVAELEVLFQSRNCCDFNAITLAALRALNLDPALGISDISQKLDYRIRHILIDEFQDTSASQFNLLRQLTENWQPGDGRTLFLVGDAMQSLYGFRDANVGLFVEARHHPVGAVALQALDLKVNFRSQLGVIDWVNQWFRGAFPDQPDISRGAIPYSSSIASKPESDTPAATLHLFEDDDGSAEAEQITRWVIEARKQRPTGSVAILVRTRSHLNAIIPQLKASGLRIRATEIDPLAERMAVVDAHSLTRALLNPTDRIAWLAILRAPWLGLTLEQLHSVVHRNGVSRQLPVLQAMQSDCVRQLIDHPRFVPVTDLLVQQWQQRQRRPLREWIETVWLALGGPECLSTQAELGDVRRYFDLLEQHASGHGIDDLPAFEQALAKLYSEDNTLDPDVELMTIHKSKGLEFDTVIVPQLHKTPPPERNKLIQWLERVDRNGEPELLVAPVSAYDQKDDPLYRYIKREHQGRRSLENTRVLYVAATRARHRLYLSGLVKRNEESGDLKKPDTNSLLATIWHLASALPEGVQLHQLAERMTHDQLVKVDAILRLPSEIAVDLGKTDHTLAAAEAATVNQSQTADEPEQDNVRQRMLGILLHDALQALSMRLDQADDPTTAATRRRLRWTMQAKMSGVALSSEELSTLEQWVQNTLEDERGRWLLQPHPEAQSEWVLNYHDADGKRRSAIIDRSFVSNGERWIIDYKTASPHEREPLAQFLARQMSEHRAQLLHYQQLLSAMEERPVRCALYFPAIPHWLTLPQ